MVKLRPSAYPRKTMGWVRGALYLAGALGLAACDIPDPAVGVYRCESTADCYEGYICRSSTPAICVLSGASPDGGGGTSECVPTAQRTCVGASVFQVDSCGAPTTLLELCASTCSQGTCTSSVGWARSSVRAWLAIR